MKRLAFAAVVLGAVGAIWAGQACSSTLPLNTGDDFISPTGVAIASASDRDLLYIANAGESDLRVLNICNTPTDDAGTPLFPTTCPPEQDFRFVPGPIRVRPASLPVAKRPIRLAGLRLLGATQADGGPAIGGGVLVAGAESALRLVDSNTLIAAEFGTAKTLAPAKVIDLPQIPVDVIAQQTAATDARAFALTLGETASDGGSISTAQIVVLSATLDQTGASQAQIIARCALDIIPTRMALIPGRLDKLYVGDGSPDGIVGGKGDGALEFNVADIIAGGGAPALTDGGTATFADPPACPASRRIPATDTTTTPPRARPLTALALNPETVADVHADATTGKCPDGNAPPGPGDLCTPAMLYPAGIMMLGVTGSSAVPLDVTNPNVGHEAGRLIFVRVDTAQIAPRPPHDFYESDAPPMEPLGVQGLAIDVAFLTPPPREKCPSTQNNGDRPCTIIVTNSPPAQTTNTLGAVATATDGATYFINADKRRFFNDARIESNIPAQGLGPLPSIAAAQTLTLEPLAGHQPTGFTFTPGDKDQEGDPLRADSANATGSNSALVTPGVTRASKWSATYHSSIPGLDRAGGLMVRKLDQSGNVTGYEIQLQGVDVSKFTALSAACGQPNRYCLGLDVGDYVSPIFYSAPSGGKLCDGLNAENLSPPREFPITAINGNTFEVALEDAPPVEGALNVPDSCFPIGVTVETRVGNGLGGRSWMVFQGSEVRGRLKYGEVFNGYEPRFDYPLDGEPYLKRDADGGPGELDTGAFSQDIGVSFTISAPPNNDGGTPDFASVAPKTTWVFSLASGQSPTRVTDTGAVAGFAGPLIVYNSPKVTNIVFTAVTGANSVLQIDPALVGIVNGIIAYR